MATFFFSFFFGSGVKLDEESIEDGLEIQKFLVVCLFWGGCHHPNNYVNLKVLTMLNLNEILISIVCLIMIFICFLTQDSYSFIVSFTEAMKEAKLL